MDLESFNLCRSSPHTLSTDSRVYKIGVYYLQLLHSISNQARYCSVLFSWNLLKWTTRNAHLSENDPPKPIKSLKMTPSKMPPSLTANKRPALNTRLNVFLFFFFVCFSPAISLRTQTYSGRRLSPPPKKFGWREATTGKNVCMRRLVVCHNLFVNLGGVTGSYCMKYLPLVSKCF